MCYILSTRWDKNEQNEPTEIELDASVIYAGLLWPFLSLPSSLFCQNSSIKAVRTKWGNMFREKMKEYLSWTYDGVDNNLPGNGGEECINFIPPKQKLIETIIFTSISCYWLYWAWPKINIPGPLPVTKNFDCTGKKVLLVLHVFFFGIEVGFKFATRQMIWILNPCHIITMMQVSRFNYHVHGMIGGWGISTFRWGSSMLWRNGPNRSKVLSKWVVKKI